MPWTTVCLKNDTALACYNFDMHHPILIFWQKCLAKMFFFWDPMYILLSRRRRDKADMIKSGVQRRMMKSLIYRWITVTNDAALCSSRSSFCIAPSAAATLTFPRTRWTPLRIYRATTAIFTQWTYIRDDRRCTCSSELATTLEGAWEPTYRNMRILALRHEMIIIMLF